MSISDRKRSGQVSADVRKRELPAWLAVARGTSLFLGVFFLLTVAGELRYPGPDSDLAWIDLRPAELSLTRGFLGSTGVLLLLFGVTGQLTTGLRLAAAVLVTLAFGIAIGNAIGVYRESYADTQLTGSLVPASLNLAATLGVVLAGLTVPAGRSVMFVRDGLLGAVAFVVCGISFPLTQMFCHCGNVVPQADATVIVVPDADVARPAQCARMVSRLRKEAPNITVLIPMPPRAGVDRDALHRVLTDGGIPSQIIIPVSPAESVREFMRSAAESIRARQAEESMLVCGFHRGPRAELWMRRSGVRIQRAVIRKKTGSPVTLRAIASELPAIWIAWLDPLAR